MNSLRGFQNREDGTDRVEVSPPASLGWPEAPRSLHARLVWAGREVGLDDPAIDAQVCDYVAELLGSGYDHVTVRQVLPMTSGVNWVEDYHDPDSPASRMLARWRTGQGGLRDCLMTITGRHRRLLASMPRSRRAE